MATAAKRVDEAILQNAFRERWGELSHANPMVLSCGGIYIPHSGDVQRISYHILTTSDENMPVKVVTGCRPRNILQLVMEKESMN